MSFPTFPGKRRKHEQPNLKLEDIPMDSLLALLTTSKGWIIRQALKFTGNGLAALGAYVTAKATALNIPVDQVQAVLTPFQAFASAAVVLLIELGLSFLARKNK